MALSILIPVYNFNVLELVKILSFQLQQLSIDGEIIILDDASTQFLNDYILPIQELPLVIFYANKKNEGRLVSRKLLASFAKYDHLLFLDCDSGIINKYFLKTYVEEIKKQEQLVSGGRIYPAAPPDDNYILHWKYGTLRESKKESTAFMSNNFLVKKELFDRLANDSSLQGYGHEDTWWGIQFKEAGIFCKHIDNPVLHLQLENSVAFLKKSEQALKNLLVMEKLAGEKTLSREVKIYRWYNHLRSAGIAEFFNKIESRWHNYFKKNLLSADPRLLYFDLYRLGELVRLKKSQSNNH